MPVFLALAFFVFFLPESSSASEASGFRVERIGQMISNSDNGFLVHSPENGEFCVTVYDSYHIYRTISEMVYEGENTISWDGCAYNQERLDTHYYFFDFSLTGESGKTYSYSFSSPVVDNAQKLQFALPSGNRASVSGEDIWFLEAKSVFSGTLVLEFVPEGSLEPAATYQKTLHQGKVEHYTFHQIIGQKPPAPGQYTVYTYELSKPADIISFSLFIDSDTPEKQTVRPTGNIMPARDSDDSQIWETMIQPSVVIDIDYLSHQNVYEDKNLKSAVLGTLHGQTQCVSVLEIDGDWARIGAWNHEEAVYIEGWVPYSVLKIVESNQDYGLLVDKKAQTLTVFYRGERIEELLVSTGRMEKNKYEQETAAGCYVTGLHRVGFSTMGNRYDFVIQYDGGNLLHQIPYTSNGNKDFTMGRAYLGSKASHACIRIQDEPGSVSGINAYWIWTHIPYHTKLIILDDPEECMKEKAYLSGISSLNPTDSTNKSAIESGDQTVKITFGGDVIPGWPEDHFGSTGEFGAFYDQFGAAYPFGGIKSILESDDLSCVNLGCVLKENREGENYSSSQRIRGLPEYADIFPNGSVELVVFSNDHVFDYQESGCLSTIHAVAQKTGFVSSSNPLAVRIKDCLFGFAACTEAEYLLNPHIISEDIQLLKSQNCQYIIYQCHWGNERESGHGKLQEAMARACEREGADLVIGIHPSSIQGIDYINQMPVLYGIGSLIPCSTGAGKNTDALLVQAVFNLSEEKETPEMKIIPVLTSSDPGKNDFRPVIAESEDKDRIFMKIQTDSVIDLSGWMD